MSSSCGVGDRAQVDAVKGPSGSGVARVAGFEDLHMGAKLKLAVLLIANQ